MTAAVSPINWKVTVGSQPDWLLSGVELATPVTWYATFIGIHMTTRFVIVTFAAHAVFGAALGSFAKWLAEE